jgi:hypothetical protein
MPMILKLSQFLQSLKCGNDELLDECKVLTGLTAKSYASQDCIASVFSVEDVLLKYVTKGKRFFSTPQRPHRSWGPHNLLTQWAAGAIRPVIKCLGREPDHSPPSGAYVKNGGDIPLLLYKPSWLGD